MAKKQTAFLWEGSNATGKPIRGEMTTDNIYMARATLHRQGIQIKKIRKLRQALFARQRKKKITRKDIALFARQLATTVSAGVPLVQAFDIVGQSNRNPAMQAMLASIKQAVEEGSALHEALRKHPRYFDALFCSLVQAGEYAGVLDNLLHKIATHKEKIEHLKSNINKALYYPVTVLVIALLVTTAIMVFVVPQFTQMFNAFGAELPIFTQIIVQVADFVGTYWWVILAFLLVVGFMLYRLWQHSAHFHEMIDRLLLGTPIIGNIMHKSALSRFCRTTAIMFAAGVPLVEALGSAANTTGNTVYCHTVLAMRDDIATGQSLQFSMSQQTLFPPMLIQMVAIGEASGALDTMLEKVADLYTEEVDNAVDALSSLLEPVMIVILGGLISSLVIALYLPMFQIGAVMSSGG